MGLKMISLWIIYSALFHTPAIKNGLVKEKEF
jgi:hypothetical protein